MCGCLSRAPYWRPGLQPRHGPWLGIKQATLWFTVWHSIHWATPARAELFLVWRLNSLRCWPGWCNLLHCGTVLRVGEGSEREQCSLLSSPPAFKRLAVSPEATTPTDLYSQWFWGFIPPHPPCWSPGLCDLPCSPFVPPSLSTH